MSKLNEIMELQKFYSQVLVDVLNHPEQDKIEASSNYQEVKAKVVESLEGDSEFDYIETWKDVKYMESFLTIS